MSKPKCLELKKDNAIHFRVDFLAASKGTEAQVAVADKNGGNTRLSVEETRKVHAFLEKVLKTIDAGKPFKVKDSKLLTSHDVGVLLQMDPSSVVKWVNDGTLTAYRTPGGHRRITAGELRKFIATHNMAMPSELEEVASEAGE